MEPLREKKLIPDKLFYKIGEVSKLAGVEPYVLRYWESEFPFLKPRKAGQRVYTKKEIELVLQIKRLLYQEKYTIAGVKRKFSENSAKRDYISEKTVKNIQKRLKEILRTLK